MFEGEDVEGTLKEDIVKETGINGQSGGVDIDMETTLKWAVYLLLDQLPLIVNSEY
jgi:nicotinamide/nicotinate riboside kinase